MVGMVVMRGGIAAEDFGTIQEKGPVSGACHKQLQRQKSFDVALDVLQAMPVCRAFAADQRFARRMLKNIMLCLSMQNKAMLFNKRKQFSSIVLEGH